MRLSLNRVLANRSLNISPGYYHCETVSALPVLSFAEGKQSPACQGADRHAGEALAGQKDFDTPMVKLSPTLRRPFNFVQDAAQDKLRMMVFG